MPGFRQGTKYPKAQKKPGAPKKVPGRESKVEQRGQKWAFQFKRGDLEDVLFDTEAEAVEYARHIKAATLKTASLRVSRG